MEMMQMDLGDAMGDSDSDTTVDMSNRQPSGMDTPPPREASPSLPQMEGYNPSDSFSDSSSNLLKPNFNSTHDDISKGNVIDFSSSLENTTSSGSGLLVPETVRRGTSSVLDSLLDQKLKSMMKKKKKGDSLYREQKADRSVDGKERGKDRCELSDVSDDDAIRHPQVDKESSECNSEEIMDFGEDEPLMLTSEDEYSGTDNLQNSDSHSKSRQTETIGPVGYSSRKRHDGGTKTTKHGAECNIAQHNLKDRSPTKPVANIMGRDPDMVLDDESMEALGADRPPSEYDSQEEEETTASWKREKESWMKEKKHMDETAAQQVTTKGEESEEDEDEEDDDEEEDDEEDEDEYEFFEDDDYDDEAIDSLIKGEADEDGTDTPKTVDGENADTEDEPSIKKRKRIVKKRKKKCDPDADDSGDDSEIGVGGKKKRRKKDKKKIKEEKEKEDEEKEEREKEKEGQRKGARKNIRKILTEDKLESATKDAQQEEFERKQRLQELRERLAYQQRVAEEGRSELKSLLEDEESDGKEDDIMVVSPNQAKKEERVEKGKGDEKGKKDEDVITLSSSDDDCKVVPSEPELEDEDDPDNSGLHVKDELNLPDEQGRVLVNLSHPPEEADIFLAPQLAAAVKPHQIGGIRFLYDNLVESVGRYKTSNGFGCILAHSMGLGKTIQLISFTDIFLRCTPAKTALVIVPVNTLQNWLHEFDMWLPHADSDTIKHAPPDMILPRKFEVFYINDSHKTPAARAEVVTKWVTDGGCLLMGYEMYRLLTSKKTLAPKPKRNKKNEIIDLEEEDKNKQRLHKIQEALLKPGPDLVICDEGHRIKNSHASISQALKNLKTKRRVVLTGYPLQNNLLEYWCMVDFVRPNYLGTKTEFSNMFERPIMNGQCVDSTPQDRKLMRYRSHVLHSLLSGFVQRRGHSVLKKALPPKEEHVIFVRMSPIQRQLYKAFMDSMQSESLQNMVSSNPLKAFSVCCKIWNHPDVLYNVMQARKEADEDDLDIGEELTPTPTTKKKGRGTKSSSRSSGASTPAPTPPLLPPANPMSQFGPVGGMGGRMNTPPWNQGINSYGGPGHNSQGMYGMGPMGNMGSMGMGQSGMHMGQYGRNGQMNYGPGGPMNMGQGMGPSMGQNMGPNGPMNMGQHGMGQNSAMNMGQQGMGQQDMGQQGMGQNMGQQSMDHSGVPKNPGAPMGMNMNASQNIGPHQEHDMASNDRQDIGSSGQHGQPNMGMNESQHMGPNGSQGMSPNGPQNMGSIGPNRPPSMGSNNSQNMGSNGPQCMDPNRSHGMGPNGPHSMGSNRGQNMGLNGAQNMGPNGPQNMGQNGPESMGSNGPQNMGPNGPQNMGPNGPQNMGPNGPQNMGPNGPQNMGPNGPQNMGPNGPQNMGHNVPQNMGPNGPQNMGPNGSQNMGPNGAQNIGPNGPQNMGANGPQSMGPNGPQNMGPNGPQNMGLNGPQNMGPNGPQNMGPNGAQGIGPNGPPNLCTNGPQNMGPNAPQTMGSGGHHSMGPSGSQNMEPSGPHNMGPNGPAIMDPNGPQNMGQNGPQNMRPNGPQGMGPNGPQGMGPNGPQGMGSGGSQNMSQNMGIGMNQNSQMNIGANGPQGMGSYNQMDPYNRSMGQYNQSMGMYGQPPMSGYNQSIGPYGKNSMMLSQSMDRNQMMGHMGPNRPGMEMPGQPVGPSGPYYGGPHNMGMSGPNSSLSGPGPMETHNQPPGPDISSGPPTEPPGPRHYGYYPKAVTPPSSTSTDSKTTTSKSDAALSTDTKKHVLAAGSPTKDLKPNMTTTTTTSSVGTTPTPSDDSKDDKSKIGEIKADDEAKETKEKKEPNEISYEWAEEILKTYKRGMMENGGKIVLLMALIEETLRAGDKILVFSQSLFTLNLIEEYLQRSRIPLPYPNNEYWARNRSYFRLDGSTSGTDRERLINQFNAYNNTNIHVFLLSTRAGCLGINLIGANRVVVLDASWNPCHDCQAVCRVYRYGQLKRCYVYRFVTDNTLEKKIYDRQINKQGMSDRVVDELQPQTNFTRNQVDTLLEYDDQDFKPIKPDKEMLAKFEDLVLKDIVNQYCSWITKPPFTHESLLIDKKEEKLTKTDKRLAKQGYEMEKKMNISYTRPSYSTFYQKDGAANRMPMAKQVTIVYKKTANGEVKQVICIPTRQPQIGNRPIASVRPMMSTPVSVPARSTPAGTQQGSIPVSSLLRPGVTVHQIQTTTDINIPSNAANNTGPQKIPAGETVLIIKTPKGVYIRTNNGKIFAVRSAPKGTEVTPGTPAPTGPMKLPAPSTATSPILQQTLTKSSDPGKVTTLSTKGVTDLLSGGSLLANQRKDGMKLISRERMQTLLQQGKIVTPKGMPITLISNPNMPMANMAKLGNPMGQKVPGGVRIIRPDKFASVQIAKAAAAAKAGVPNVDTKKEAAAIVADVLARYNENQVGQGGINPMVKIIRQDPKEEGAKTALVKDADGKLVIKTLPPGMNLKPIVKDDCVKPQLLKDIEMVREKEMAKGKEHMAITNDLNTSVDATKRLTQDAIRKLDMEPPEKTEKAPGDTANEPRNLTALANKDTLSIKDDVKAQQPTSPKEIQREKENIGQWSQDIPLHNKVDTLDKDPVPITVATTSATSTTNKDMTPQVTKAGTSLLNKDLPGDRRQERDTINGPMLWDQNTSMFRGSSSDSGGVDSTRQMSTSQMSNYTPSSQRSGGQYTMSSGGNINNYGSNQFDMNVQTSMATPASSGMDQQGTMERDSSYSNNQFMGNQEFMGRSSSNASSMSSSQFGAIGGAGSGAGSDTLSGAGSGSRSGNSANLQSVASSMSSGRAGDMNMTYSISGQSMDGQFPIRNQYNDPMSSMSQNMSNMDRPSDLMSRAMPTQTSVGNQMDIRRSDSIGSQSSIGSNSTTNIGSQFSMGGQPSGSLGSQSGLASQPPAMPGQFSNIGRDNIDKISANSMGSPSSMASQFSMGSQPTMSRSEMGNSQSSMGSTQNMGSPQNMGSMPSMGNSLNMGSTPSMVNSLNMGSTPSMGSSQSMRSTSNLGSSQNIGSSQSMGSTSSMGSSQSMSRSQSMGRPSSMDSQFPDLGRTGTSDSHFSMGGSSQPSSQQSMSMPSESLKCTDLSSTPRDYSRSSSANSQHTTKVEPRGMASTKEPSPAKRHESKSTDRSADRNTRPSSTTSSKAESLPHSSNQPMDWSSNHTSSSTSVNTPPKPTADSASSLLKEMVPPTTTQQPEHAPSYPSFSSSMSSPYGSTPGYSMPPIYPSHMGHSSGYGMSHHGLSPWYSGLSPWSAPPSYPGMAPTDAYAKHMSGSTPAMSSYPGMSGYSGYHGNAPGMVAPKDKDGDKDRLSLSTSRHGSSSKDSLDMAGSAFDMQSSNPLSAMSAMSGMSSMGSGPHSAAIGNRYHPQSSHSMQSGGMGSAYGAYPYHHMSPLSHPMYPPPPGGSSAYNYMSPYSGMPSTMMQHLPGSMPPLHPLSDMDPSRPPHMGP